MTDDQQLPQDITAEKSVLGAMMMDAYTIPIVIQHMRPTDMYRPAHQKIMQAILDLWGNGIDIDPIVLVTQMDKDGTLDSIGGAPYIHDLVRSSITAANVEYHVKRVADEAVRRRVLQAGVGIVQTARDTADADIVLNRAQQLIGEVGRPTSDTIDQVGQVVPTVMDEMQAIMDGVVTPATPTGYADLDEALSGGLRAGQMVIIAARPGVGKSTAGVDILRHVAAGGRAALLFTLEMSKSEVVQRIISAEAEVRLSDMRQGAVDELSWKRIANSLEHLEDLPMFIDDSPTLTMMEIRAKARRIKQQHPSLGVIMVDYLQLLTSGRKVDSRQQEVSEFSRQLKLLAKELEVPVIAVSQLNRGVEARGDGARPRLSDLRESGSLEQDADIVILIDRPDAGNPDHERAGEADLIIAKHRGGPLTTITVANQLQYSKFATFAPNY